MDIKSGIQLFYGEWAPKENLGIRFGTVETTCTMMWFEYSGFGLIIPSNLTWLVVEGL